MQEPDFQVNSKVLLGEVRPVRAARHPGNQGASRRGEGLTGTAVAVSGVAHGLRHRHAGVGLTLFHQFQRPQVVWSVAGQYRHGGNQLGVGVHHNRRLMPVEPPPAAALVPVAQLRVVHRHHPVPAHPILEAHSVISACHVLEQQSAQQFRRGHNPLPLGAFLSQFPLRLPDNSRSRSASATISASRAFCARLSLQSMAASPFTLEPRYRWYPRTLRPFPDVDALQLRQRPQQFDDSVGQ